MPGLEQLFFHEGFGNYSTSLHAAQAQNLEAHRVDFLALGWEAAEEGDPLGPLGFGCSHHRQTLRPSVDGIRNKALRPFGVLERNSRIQQYSPGGGRRACASVAARPKRAVLV